MSYTNINALFEALKSPHHAKRVFTHIEGKEVTYQQLCDGISKIHALLQTNGCRKGDKIVLSAQQDYDTALFFLAFLTYGIVTIFIDPDVPDMRATALIEKAAPDGFVMDEALFAKRNVGVSAATFQLKIKHDAPKIGKLFQRLLKSKTDTSTADVSAFPAILDTLEVPKQSPEPVADTDLAYILFTSGTTSAPKGVMITHGNLFAHLQTLTKVYGLNQEARLLNILMLYHADGSIQGPLLTAYNQACWVRPFRFDLTKIEELFHSIYKYKISHFIAVPTLLSFMNKFSEGYEDSFQATHFQFIISVASQLETPLWRDMEQKFGTQVVNVYGLTETVAGSLFSGANGNPRKIGTVGIPIDCEAKILRADGTPAQAQEAGDLWLKGAHIFRGYLSDDDATNAVLQDGWLNTGDIAVQDAEGFYSITGRSKNTVNSGGINIYPEQVTEMVNSHPDVLESICLGVADEAFGEKLVCALTLKPDKNLSKLDLLQFLRPLLEQNQIPKEFYFIADLPKGLSGKIQIEAVKALIQAQSAETTHDYTSSVEAKIKEAASEAFGVEITRLNMSDTSNTLEGWDSMAHLLFITQLEKSFKVRFSTAEMITMNSLTTAANMVNRKLIQH